MVRKGEGTTTRTGVVVIHVTHVPFENALFTAGVADVSSRLLSTLMYMYVYNTLEIQETYITKEGGFRTLPVAQNGILKANFNPVFRARYCRKTQRVKEPPGNNIAMINMKNYMVPGSFTKKTSWLLSAHEEYEQACMTNLLHRNVISLRA